MTTLSAEAMLSAASDDSKPDSGSRIICDAETPDTVTLLCIMAVLICIQHNGLLLTGEEHVAIDVVLPVDKFT